MVAVRLHRPLFVCKRANRARISAGVADGVLGSAVEKRDAAWGEALISVELISGSLGAKVDAGVTTVLEGPVALATCRRFLRSANEVEVPEAVEVAAVVVVAGTSTVIELLEAVEVPACACIARRRSR